MTDATDARAAIQAWCPNCHGRGQFGFGGDISTCGRCGGSGKEPNPHATGSRAAIVADAKAQERARIIAMIRQMQPRSRADDFDEGFWRGLDDLAEIKEARRTSAW